jgi:SOS-response transcriptional repressor LexA
MVDAMIADGDTVIMEKPDGVKKGSCALLARKGAGSYSQEDLF